MNNQGEIYEVTTSNLVYGGDTIARLPDGMAVFIPFALPGESVRIRLTGKKHHTAHAELLEVLQPAAGRIAPRCQHFGICGGCHYQHMSYELQTQTKSSILAEQLQRLAGLSKVNIQDTIPSPMPWHYRNSIQFHLDGSGKPGFQQAGSHKVVAINECCLPEPPLDELWKILDFEPIPTMDRIELRHAGGDDVLLVIESRDPLPPQFEVDIPLSAIFLGPEGDYLLSGDDHLIMEVNDRPFHVHAGSFFQVNTPMARKMIDCIQSNLDLNHNTTLLDIYSGVGLFSAFLAPLVGRCAAVEISPYATRDFVINLDEYDNVELYEGAAEDILPSLDIKAEVAIVDPPRGGLEVETLNGLLSTHPQTLVYVSCDPATLARDAKRLLAGGYSLEKVIPLDMFPQTYHIESISFFHSANP